VLGPAAYFPSPDDYGQKLIRDIRGLALCVPALAAAVAWHWLTAPHDIDDWQGRPPGVSFAPFTQGANPLNGLSPSREQIAADLALLKGSFHAVRIYSSRDTLAEVPELADAQDLNVAAGAWISPDEESNREEIEAMIALVKGSHNAVRAIVGNEALLREEISVPQLAAYLKEVRDRLDIPVSTAEPWHIWLRHPELAEVVDYIGIHILPYWEGLTVDEALPFIENRLDTLKRAFPGKPIVILEVGWPSRGRQMGKAVASPVTQAQFLRRFASFAAERDLTYYIIEAFDQPWKLDDEGSAGAYWGLYDANRRPKAVFVGPVAPYGAGQLYATFSIGIGFLAAVIYARRRHPVRPGALFIFAAITQVASASIAWALADLAGRYFDALSGGVTAALIFGEMILVAVVLAIAVELADVISGRALTRLDLPRKTLARSPKVSIHVPCYNEPPEMVAQTLDALARLDYANFEVIVVDNNTRDENVWRPLERHCMTLGSRFRFFHVAPLSGYKAGALNFALKHTAENAEIIGVVDSDYVVQKSWLADLVPHFETPGVVIVQAPQDYRDRDDSLFKRMCYWEYAGFFHIGMVERNEANAIIQHGTMTLVTRTALDQVDGWSEWCITEDAELGLKLFRAGCHSVYVPKSYGRGLIPDDLAAYVTQRARWVYGAMMILKRHRRAFFPGRASGLNASQRYHFMAGWLPWLADGLGFLFALAALIWSAGMIFAPRHFEVPLAFFILPMLALFAFRILHGVWTYAQRVPCTLGDRLLAALAGLALSHTVAKGVLAGLLSGKRPFKRTPKCRERPHLFDALRMVWEESLLLILFACAASGLALSQNLADKTIWIFMGVLIVQAIPYFASLAAALISIFKPGQDRRSVISTPASGDGLSSTPH
jgi:exo-beta-1,3-glucanase (GH17 family)/cellulose synthase/poly-beta-1,6-N-acetylglucosamine synthase-like glycosyltransferase